MRKIFIAAASLFATAALFAAPAAPVFAASDACTVAAPSHSSGPVAVDGSLTWTVIADAC